MSTVTDAETRAALNVLAGKVGGCPGLGLSDFCDDTKCECMEIMKTALEAAEAVRVKPPLTMRVDSDPRVSQSAAFVAPVESNLQKVQIPTPTIPEGFIPWSGGECPVAEGTKVDYKMLDNGLALNESAERLRWEHKCWSGDIIAYRIHKPADFKLEAGKYYITASGERVGPMKPYRSPFGARFTIEGDARLWMPEGTLDGRFYDILALAADQGENNE